MAKKSTQCGGRLCNHFFRNVPISQLCKKNDLFFEYSFYNELNELGIPLFIGSKTFKEITLINDNNFLEFLNDSKPLESNILFEHQDIYFQTKEISNYLNEYLFEIKDIIVEKNPFKERYQNNNDVFIHIRLGDIPQYNPGLNYYLKALENLTYDKVYISSDSPNHLIIHELRKRVPNSEIVFLNEIKTLQFGSTCKTIILSHGTFSAVIGYLSFYSNVSYPSFKNMRIWHGDIFSIPSWNCIEF
jgi:hypothetical protein